MHVPVEPPSSRWAMPSVDAADEHGLVAVGADLEPGTLLAAYRTGLFPMPVNRRLLGWWSPDPRGVIPMGGLVVSRSLRRSLRRFEVSFDRAFEQVITRCADERRPGRWITTPIRSAYGRLHQLGWAHSVEVWNPHGRLVGGLYGVAVGGLFAGESMFHLETDASKVALVALVERLTSSGFTLLDVQWTTPHLRSLGAEDLSRARYLDELAEALAAPAAWGVGSAAATS